MSPPFCYQYLRATSGGGEGRKLGRRHIDTGRKTYKLCTKSQTKKREPVWPPILESALLEGLAQYVPSSTKDPSLLQRFPRRNVCISQHIKEKTGKYRTPKQVGSRLQQLRETCCDKYILNLIGSKDFSDRSSSERTLSPTDSLFSTSSYEISRVHYEPSSPTTEESRLATQTPFSVQFTTSVALALYDFDCRGNTPNVPPIISLDLDETALTTSSSSSPAFLHPAEVRTVGPVSQCSPILRFTSNRFSPDAQYRCVSDVYIDGKHVYNMPALLEVCSPTADAMTFYKMELGHDVWAILTRDSEAYASYTMTQNIYTISTGTIHDECPVFTITYALERGFDAPAYPSSIADISQRQMGIYEPQWTANMQGTAQADYGYTLDFTPEASLTYGISDTVDMGYQIAQVPQLSLLYTHPNDFLSLPQDPASFQTYY